MPYLKDVILELGVVVQNYNSSIWEVKSVGS
jgi:hypothetical protein